MKKLFFVDLREKKPERKSDIVAIAIVPERGEQIMMKQPSLCRENLSN